MMCKKKQLAALQRPVWFPQKRLSLFIEGANLLHGARKIGIDVDFDKPINYASRGCSLTVAKFYTGVDCSWVEEQRFHSRLRELGYEVVDKPIKQLSVV